MYNVQKIVHSARHQTVRSLCSKKKKNIFLAHVSVPINEKFISIGHRLGTRQVELGLDSQRALWSTGYSKITLRKFKSLAFQST